MSIDWNGLTKPYTCKLVYWDTVLFLVYIANKQTNYLLTICKKNVVDNKIKCSF